MPVNILPIHCFVYFQYTFIRILLNHCIDVIVSVIVTVIVTITVTVTVLVIVIVIVIVIVTVIVNVIFIDPDAHCPTYQKTHAQHPSRTRTKKPPTPPTTIRVMFLFFFDIAIDSNLLCIAGEEKRRRMDSVSEGESVISYVALRYTGTGSYIREGVTVA